MCIDLCVNRDTERASAEIQLELEQRWTARELVSMVRQDITDPYRCAPMNLMSDGQYSPSLGGIVQESMRQGYERRLGALRTKRMSPSEHDMLNQTRLIAAARNLRHFILNSRATRGRSPESE
jgi:hypothetical protein